MIAEYLFAASLLLYIGRLYFVDYMRAYNKSVFESSEILSHKLRDGQSLETAIEFISRSDIRCKKLFGLILERIDRGDNVVYATDHVAKKLSGPALYLMRVIGCASRYNQNISLIFVQFYKDMKSAYMIGEERKKELVTQGFIVFLIGSILVPLVVVMMANMFTIELPFFIIVFLFAQSYLAAVATGIVLGKLWDAIFLIPLGVSITMLIIKYGLGAGVL